jgi:hypothetical protein
VAVLAGGCMVSTSAWANAPRQACMADADCAEGVACIDGVCGEAQVEDPSECDVDADCSAGFSCQVVGALGDCAEPAPDEPNTPPGRCGSQEFRMCVPPPPAQCDPAQMSADCSGGLICVTYTFESCSGGVACACPEGAECDCADVEPSEPSCQSEAESYCVPPYLAPCDADADCGSGFTCEAEEICTASCTDTPRDPADPDGDVPDGMGSCSSECAPAAAKYCKIVERPCAADAECGAGFSCVAPPSSSTPSTCVVDSDGNEFCDDGAPDEPGQSYCLPDGWEQWGGQPGRDSDSPVSSNNDGELIGAESARPPRQDDSGFPESADASDGGGCMSSTTGGGAAGSGLGLLALMAGMLGWRRRRA